ncbi:MAG: hypothetical protein QOE06_1008 [Thermoleophilaceae bacterium]|jgi:hypothetical protein|nr:hypothetical protein [Thermoleophilaceae bacterium]
MKTPSQFTLSRLSRELYAEFLGAAKARGFGFAAFRDLHPSAPAPSGNFIALRHDVDFAPAYSLEMAELEHDAGVVATYFVLVDGQHYNPLEAETVRRLRRIRELGHEVGLHFAVGSAVHADPGEEVAFRLRLLGDIVGAPVRSFSQHDPVNAGFAEVRLPPGHEECVDAAEAIRAHDLLYVSDSAMMWREHTFASALEQGRNLCLLAHPHSWLHPEDDYVALIRALEAREVERLTARFDAFVHALTGYYERRRREGV